MVPKLNPLKVQKTLLGKGIKIFTPLEFQRVFSVSYDTARKFLLRYSRKKFITKLRAGLYTLTDNPPSEFEIANRLYGPSYISLEFALAHYQIIPEMIYTVTSVTTQSTRKFEALGLTFTYQKMKKQAFCGYRPEKINDSVVLIAEPEKALVDYLYFIDLKKRKPLERIDLKKLSKKKVLEYARPFKRKSLIKLIKEVYALTKRTPRIY